MKKNYYAGVKGDAERATKLHKKDTQSTCGTCNFSKIFILKEITFWKLSSAATKGHFLNCNGQSTKLFLSLPSFRGNMARILYPTLVMHIMPHTSKHAVHELLFRKTIMDCMLKNAA